MEAFPLRLWDSRIGRWLSTDSYRQYASPYLGMGNNPNSRIDPDGGCTKCPKNGVAGDTYNHSEWGVLTPDDPGYLGNDRRISNPCPHSKSTI